MTVSSPKKATTRARTIQRMKDRLVELRAKKATIDSTIGRMERAMVKTCVHPKEKIREMREERCAPWTICLECGYAEEGWGIGGWKLPSGYIDHMPIPSISYREFHKARTFFRSQRLIVHEKIHVKAHGENRDTVLCKECGRD